MLMESFFVASILWFCMFYERAIYYMHMLQLEGYSNRKFKKWVFRNQERIYSNLVTFMNVVIVIAINFMILYTKKYTSNICMLIYNVLFAITFFSFAFKKRYTKKHFVVTSRVKRLFCTFSIISLILYIGTIILVQLLTKSFMQYLPICMLLYSVYYFFAIRILIIVNSINYPIEKLINRKYYNRAKNKIKDFKNLKIVGITGSYGKTSTKFIMGTIAKEKYDVLMTPASYNTPMGISKVINNDLKENHKIFIAEMGATKIGDIKELAILTNPEIGILTSIGKCHMESFKSINNVCKAKYELIENLPVYGVSVFNYDNEYVRELADNTNNTKKVLYGLHDIEKLDVYADNINVSENGSKFDLHVKGLGSVECQTCLLGEHNISNVLAGVCGCVILGLNLDEIKSGIGKIEPVEHRLQLINSGNGILVIDDAFNSNPDGANAALDVLAQFEDRRKIIITPGMVELGTDEYDENFKFGEKIAKVCDIVILVGKNRTKAIYDGIQMNVFDAENIYLSESTKDTDELIRKLTRKGDVILFENDLPDTYDEK